MFAIKAFGLHLLPFGKLADRPAGAGKEARIKLDAYPFQKYGTASGEVRTISQPAAPFFKARILLADTRLNASDVPVRLLPGMTVSTEIKVGKRTVISYFLYPLMRGLDDAIREPN